MTCRMSDVRPRRVLDPQVEITTLDSRTFLFELIKSSRVLVWCLLSCVGFNGSRFYVYPKLQVLLLILAKD